MHKTPRDLLKRDFEAVRHEGINNANERVAKDMLKKTLPLSLIEEISKLSEDTIRNLANSIGIAVL